MDETSKSLNNYEQIAINIAAMLRDKQSLYGDAYPKVEACLQILYPNGIQTSQYGDIVYVTRIIEKLSRIANRNKTNKLLEKESPFRDIVGTAFLAMINDESKDK